MAGVATVGTPKHRKRAGAACDFCRQRKLGCDNAGPRCENCRFHGRDCIYTARAKKERPSNSRISRLEEDNARLRRLVMKTKPDQVGEQTESQTTNPHHLLADHVRNGTMSARPVSEGNGTITQRQISPCNWQLKIAPGEHSTSPVLPVHFHGPSSAIFDEESPRKGPKKARGSVTEGNAKSLVLAEAAKQRQMEHINLRSGKLEFDGVDPALAMQLLSVFWNRQHHSGSTVYRPSFMRDMACQGPYYSPLLLNSILFVASKNLEKTSGECLSTDECEGGMTFRRKAEDILHRHNGAALFRSRITTIQALLILSDALFSWCDERALSWHYLGVAINMIIDLGMQTESSTFYKTNSRSVEDIEVHRRIFWAAFIQDKVQSIYQGRPARLRELDAQVPIIFLDEFEELEQFNALGYSTSPGQIGSPTHGVSIFEQLCRLSLIADRILCGLYTEQSLKEPPEKLIQTSKSLHTQLHRWRELLPEHLIPSDVPGSTSVLPHTLCLLSMYNSLIILLKRPFVSAGHLQSVGDSAAGEAFSICTNAASDIDGILHLYKKHFCLKSAPYFMSYATYVSATIHVRIAAQMPSGSKWHGCLRTCLEVLSEHQIKCHAPRRSLKVLIGLINRLGVDVGNSFVALPSRTSEIKMGELAGNGLTTTHIRAHDTSYSPNTSAVDHSNVDQQHTNPVTLESLDIDEIMKTFDIVPERTRQLSQAGLALEEDAPSTTPVNVNCSNDSIQDSHAALTPFAESLNEMLQNFDVPFDYDSLFGFGTSEYQGGLGLR